MALNPTSNNLLNCISLISSSVEVSCSFIWDLFLCFTILAISVGLGVCQSFLWLLVFCCLWLPLLGLDECGRTHIKHHREVLLTWVDFQAQDRFSYPLGFCLEAISLGYLKSLGFSVKEKTPSGV
uniref:Uncharacterized protein n=1 Tax=Molossus molossus TaxID=27622 RepID=A0A7J8J836_MOLMO|nr:hypothetical protein HJG59_009702 [Molossus molossus]